MRGALLPRIVTIDMDEHSQTIFSPPACEKLEGLELVGQIFAGIGIALGLSLLWALETVRDGTFKMLDRLNLRARTRHVSAFPPGQPRKLVPRSARQ